MSSGKKRGQRKDPAYLRKQGNREKEEIYYFQFFQAYYSRRSRF